MTGPRRGEGRDSALCGARRRRSGERCRRPAGWGTPTPGLGPCKLHGGSTAPHRRRAERILAERAVAAYGLPIDIPADLALLQEVHRTAGHVAALAAKVASLDESELAWGIAEQTERAAGREAARGESDDESAATASATVVDTKRKAAPSVWVAMYRDERRHLVDVCKTVAGLQLEERQTRIAERQGEMLAALISSVLEDGQLGLSSTQRAVAVGLVAERIRQLTGGPPP